MKVPPLFLVLPLVAEASEDEVRDAMIAAFEAAGRVANEE